MHVCAMVFLKPKSIWVGRLGYNQSTFTSVGGIQSAEASERTERQSKTNSLSTGVRLGLSCLERTPGFLLWQFGLGIPQSLELISTIKKKEISSAFPPTFCLVSVLILWRACIPTRRTWCCLLGYETINLLWRIHHQVPCCSLRFHCLCPSPFFSHHPF